MPVIFPILFETKASLGLLEWTNGAACSSRGNPRHGTAGTGAGKSQAAAGSWGHHGLTSYCSNTPQLSVEAVRTGGRHRRALTSCKQTPPPVLGRDKHRRDRGVAGVGPSRLSSAGCYLTQTDGHVRRNCCDFTRIAAFRTTALRERCRQSSGKHRFPVILPCLTLIRFLR